MPTKLTETERDEARRLYLSNKSTSVDDLCDRFGVSRATMLRYLAGVTRPRGGRERPIPTAYMRRLRDEGLTYSAIAGRVGLSTAGVQYRLNGNGRN